MNDVLTSRDGSEAVESMTEPMEMCRNVLFPHGVTKLFFDFLKRKEA